MIVKLLLVLCSMVSMDMVAKKHNKEHSIMNSGSKQDKTMSDKRHEGGKNKFWKKRSEDKAAKVAAASVAANAVKI